MPTADYYACDVDETSHTTYDNVCACAYEPYAHDCYYFDGPYAHDSHSLESITCAFLYAEDVSEI